ncbi:MAG: HD domain-containing protein [Eubacteriales bacterium]
MKKRLTLLDQAIIFTTKAHSGARRKGTNVPYIVHPIEAAAIVSAMTDDEEVIAAAVLHDVLGDSDATGEDLHGRFGRRITELVVNESEDKRKNLPAALTWKTGSGTITFLETGPDRDAKMLALADKLANLRAIHRDQCIIGGKGLGNVSMRKIREMHPWMYRSIAKALGRTVKDHPTWQEYNRLVKEVFGEEENEY